MSQIVTDDFNRANAGTLGANWTDINVGFTLAINRASLANFGGPVYTYYSGAAWTGGANQYAEATLVSTPDIQDEAGVTVRSSAGVNAYLAELGGTSVGFVLFKLVANAATNLGSSGTVALNDVLRCEAEGTTIRALVNGVTRVTVTDSAVAAGNPGLYGNNLNFEIDFDNFAAGDFGGAAVPLNDYQPMAWQQRV